MLCILNLKLILLGIFEAGATADGPLYKLKHLKQRANVYQSRRFFPFSFTSIRVDLSLLFRVFFLWLDSIQIRICH